MEPNGNVVPLIIQYIGSVDCDPVTSGSIVFYFQSQKPCAGINVEVEAVFGITSICLQQESASITDGSSIDTPVTVGLKPNA